MPSETELCVSVSVSVSVSLSVSVSVFVVFSMLCLCKYISNYGNLYKKNIQFYTYLYFLNNIMNFA